MPNGSRLLALDLDSQSQLAVSPELLEVPGCCLSSERFSSRAVEASFRARALPWGRGGRNLSSPIQNHKGGILMIFGFVVCTSPLPPNPILFGALKDRVPSLWKTPWLIAARPAESGGGNAGEDEDEDGDAEQFLPRRRLQPPPTLPGRIETRRGRRYRSAPSS